MRRDRQTRHYALAFAGLRPEPPACASRRPPASRCRWWFAQEVVNNALKHASGHEILIALEQRASALVLEVEDDGEGMQEDSARGSGLGLCVMRYRAQISGGTLDILPAPAGDTRICCRLHSPS